LLIIFSSIGKPGGQWFDAAPASIVGKIKLEAILADALVDVIGKPFYLPDFPLTWLAEYVGPGFNFRNQFFIVV
jgi:hypothetical protein